MGGSKDRLGCSQSVSECSCVLEVHVSAGLQPPPQPVSLSLALLNSYPFADLFFIITPTLAKIFVAASTSCPDTRVHTKIPPLRSDTQIPTQSTRVNELSSSASSLTDFPPELRFDIYSHLFTDFADSSTELDVPFRPDVPPIIQVRRLVRHETIPILGPIVEGAMWAAQKSYEKSRRYHQEYSQLRRIRLSRRVVEDANADMERWKERLHALTNLVYSEPCLNWCGWGGAARYSSL